MIALAVMLLAIAPLRGYLDERGQLADLRQQATVLEQQNQALQHTIDRLSDATFLERMARECLGMVKPGETAFVIVPARGKPDPPTARLGHHPLRWICSSNGRRRRFVHDPCGSSSSAR